VDPAEATTVTARQGVVIDRKVFALFVADKLLNHVTLLLKAEVEVLKKAAAEELEAVTTPGGTSLVTHTE
jgi:hypothetical protein